MKITGIDSRISRGTGRPLTLSTFVTSLEHLVQEEHFKAKDHDTQLEFVTAYWRVIKSLMPEAFSVATTRSYMVLKSMGVYALNWLAMDIFEWCNNESIETDDKNIKRFIDPLKTFDWTKKNSPLAAFGGLKGVRESYKLLLGHLKMHGIAEAATRLAKLEEDEA
jgi:hypothetical protein